MSFIGTEEERDKLKNEHPDWFQPIIVEGKGNALKWIEENRPENGVFRVYWKDVISPHEGNVTFDENEGQGLRYKWEYKDGKMVDGISQSWYPNGQLKSTINWKDGHRNGLNTEWHDNGQKRSETTYKNGKEVGVSTWWYDNGQKNSEKTYKNGKLDGLHTKWYENGQKWEEGTYKDGKEDGEWIYWYRNGQKKSDKQIEDLIKFDKQIEDLKAMSNPNRDDVNIYSPVFANNKIIYDGFRRKVENQHLRLDFIDVKGKTVVDIGCNSGYITTQLLKRGASYCLGIDLHREMINICNLIKEIDNLANIDFVQSPGWGELGYADEPEIRCVVKRYAKFDIGLLLSVPHGYNETLEWVSELIIEDWADIWYIEPTNHPPTKTKEEIKEWGETELSVYGDVEFLTFTDYQHRGLFRLDVRKE